MYFEGGKKEKHISSGLKPSSRSAAGRWGRKSLPRTESKQTKSSMERSRWWAGNQSCRLARMLEPNLSEVVNKAFKNYVFRTNMERMIVGNAVLQGDVPNRVRSTERHVCADVIAQQVQMDEEEF